MIEKVLVVDDDPLMRQFMADAIRRLGKEVSIASNGKEGIERFTKEPFDLVLSDIKMPEKNGIDLLQSVLTSPHPCPVILATAYGTIEAAVEAMKKGAFHYLIKPFSIEELESIVQRAEEMVRLIKENAFFKDESAKGLCPEMVACSRAMKTLLQNVEKIAQSQASVFITGESGTGKEVIAGAIHRLSKRARLPLIKVNCAAIPDALIESEFFGHERGAFTGALNKKAGRFELADQGTLLLDEVTEIPLSLQPKLLRAIQEQEFERVGSSRPLKVNIRFIATSNRNMQEAIASKVFREDLFYRLNVIPLHIPPLRERKEDILPLARFFLTKFCKENHKPLKTFSKAAEEKLLSYPWPGNVRELGNIVERMVVLDLQQTIEKEHLHLDTPLAEPKEVKISSLAEMEKELILQTLRAFGNDKTKSAASLGISLKTLRNKLNKAY